MRPAGKTASPSIEHSSNAPPGAVSFAEALAFWLKLGFVSFGGPAGQIAIMHQELVTRRRWISERRFLHALNYCMLLPGPEAQQLATYIGWLMHGVRGGLAAGGLFVLPSLCILIGLSWAYVQFGHVTAVAGVLDGMQSAVVAVVAFAAWRLGSRILSNPLLWAIAAAAFIAIAVAKIPFPLVIAGAGAIGFAGGRLAPHLFRPAAHDSAAGPAHERAVIDDAMPTPDHARLLPTRIASHVLVGLALWGAAQASLVGALGWEHTLAQMGWFFSKAALITFGGAYAVLPYVQQAAVESYGWLTTPQMIDGLALGETTPGPLIMVVAFVGFVGAWNHAALGPDALLAAGVLGAVICTFFTFLPSFVFIFVGGPVVESTRGDLKFIAPLTGITAAVVGVILNLALFFSYHVFWPDGVRDALDVRGLFAELDLFALILAVAAFVALVRFKVGTIAIILACGILGLMRSFM